MAVGGTPKTAGRKYSTRKILNGKRPSATLLADLLENCNDQLEQVSSQNDVPPMQISTAHPANHVVNHSTKLSAAAGTNKQFLS